MVDIITIICLGAGLLSTIIAYFVREARYKAKSKAENEALNRKIDERDAARNTSIESLKQTFTLELSNVNKSLERVENILGNGHGLINDVRELASCVKVNAAATAGEIKDIHTRLSSHQHEIDEIKAGKQHV
jgi:hypothetical protein